MLKLDRISFSKLPGPEGQKYSLRGKKKDIPPT